MTDQHPGEPAAVVGDAADLYVSEEYESSAVEAEELGAFSETEHRTLDEIEGPALESPPGSLGTLGFPSGVNLPIVQGAVGRDERDWDPNAAGNVLLDSRDGSIRLARNFAVDELAASGANRFSIARIDPGLVCALQALRDHVGVAVKVTSGYRSWGYNKEIYRKRGTRPTLSRHCSGQAVDIQVGGMSGLDIAKAAVEACGTGLGVGIGDDYAHIDVRGTWTVWNYLSAGPGAQAESALESHKGRISADLSAGFDLRRAILRNCAHSAKLGWAEHRGRIAAHLGAVAGADDDQELARGVARWQRAQGLEVDGIIGPNTWGVLEPMLGA